MRISTFLRAAWIATLLVTFGVTNSWCQAPAAAPAAAPTPTLWSFLGIPQGMHCVKGAMVDRSGCKPEKEHGPPLKSLADPSNLTSGEPGGPIQMAAMIKRDQDLAPQKIKAIRFLSTVGCSCYPGVRDALLKSLDDCSEEVRYEAALALCRVAGNCCDRCGNTCCNAVVMNKLQDVATGTKKDNPCCYKEKSERVRTAAQNALGACRNKLPPRPAENAPVEQPLKPEAPHAAPTPAVPPLSPDGLRPVLPPPPSAPEPALKPPVSPAAEMAPAAAGNATASGPSVTVMRLSAESPETADAPVRLKLVIGGDNAR